MIEVAEWKKEKNKVDSLWNSMGKLKLHLKLAKNLFLATEKSSNSSITFLTKNNRFNPLTAIAKKVRYTVLYHACSLVYSHPSNMYFISFWAEYEYHVEKKSYAVLWADVYNMAVNGLKGIY